MSDTLHLRVRTAGGVREAELDMPGKGFPDDRYRGGVVSRKL